MRELHVVALSEDGRSVLLATTKDASTGGFRVALDAKLAAALRGDLPRAGEQAVRDSTLTPKEIQSRLRAGESPEQIAAEAGVAVARVERFAGPVLSERERIVDEVRAAHVTRHRRGPSLLPLGDAVDAALAGTASLRADSVVWTARRLESGHWLVQVGYTARGRARTAGWVYDPSTRSVTASDPASAALGHSGGGPAPSRAPRAAAAPRSDLPAARRKAAPAKAAAKTAGPAKTATPAKTAAKKVAPATAAAKKGAPTKAATPPKKPAKKPAKKPTKTATRPAAVRALPEKRPASRSGRGTPAAPATRRARLEAVPDLRIVPTPKGAPKPAATRRAAAPNRASVPVWADVLLSASPTVDRTDD